MKELLHDTAIALSFIAGCWLGLCAVAAVLG